LRRFPDCFRDGLPFVEDFIVPIPQDLKPLRSQPLIAHSVVLSLCFRIMLATVQLDDQAFFEADEIDNVFSQRKLTAEFQAFEGAAAKPSPETCLCFGWKASKLPRAIQIASQRLTPSPLAPLPRGERGTRILALPRGRNKSFWHRAILRHPDEDDTPFLTANDSTGAFPCQPMRPASRHFVAEAGRARATCPTDHARLRG
jgi:hypothetical protein